MTGTLQELWDDLSSDRAWSGQNSLPALTWATSRSRRLAVLVAALIAIPPAVLLGHVRRGGVVAVSIVNIGRAIPSCAAMALILPFALKYGFGLGFWPTVAALFLLAVPPIFTNTYTGVRTVPEETLEAARGMGMRPGQLIRQVEVPVACPSSSPACGSRPCRWWRRPPSAPWWPTATWARSSSPATPAPPRAALAGAILVCRRSPWPPTGSSPWPSAGWCGGGPRGAGPPTPSSRPSPSRGPPSTTGVPIDSKAPLRGKGTNRWVASE